jgi:2-phosphosulfolactate phosphatase
MKKNANFTKLLSLKMEIRILEFVKGAREARGITVIIDVFRAFSTECYAFESGAVRIIATGSPEEAFRLKRKYPNSVLVGERNEKKIDGFDFGNSPTEIIKADLRGKTVIHTTTAGTNGLVNTINSDIVLAAGFVNAGAVAEYIKTLNPMEVSLVAMGYRAEISAEEDILCAELIAALLGKNPMPDTDQISGLRHSSGNRFFNIENIDFSPPTDFFLCTMVNKFDFALKATTRSDGNVDIMKVGF